MGKRGAKPKGKVRIQWSANFAYAIGLLVTDGNVSPTKRHVNFTSKDLELVQLFQDALSISCHVGRKANGSVKEKRYYVVQFGDVLFCNFLKEIGIGPNKTKTIHKVFVPDEYFFDFLRGHFDGDGSTYSYWDPRWRSSFMYYLAFVSASKAHILWLQNEIRNRLTISGHITKTDSSSCYQLKFAKKEATILFKKMYSSPKDLFLSRKRLKIEKTLAIVGERL